MSDQKHKSKLSSRSRVIGAKAFAAITGVEGLKLGTASRVRLQKLKASGLGERERRAEVLRAYRSAARGK